MVQVCTKDAGDVVVLVMQVNQNFSEVHYFHEKLNVSKKVKMFDQNFLST